ncbi:hypothetical protein Bca4012_065378 [Brassica carinata]|uniref:Uncharacterized protein n=1 Tax=Brassica carinata TaxID=52824 RepID=A0A8X8AWM3_BRACI|nr:hypothetical protein Bca52824_017727 [Brassica carinata]
MNLSHGVTDPRLRHRLLQAATKGPSFHGEFFTSGIKLTSMFLAVIDSSRRSFPTCRALQRSSGCLSSPSWSGTVGIEAASDVVKLHRRHPCSFLSS